MQKNDVRDAAIDQILTDQITQKYKAEKEERKRKKQRRDRLGKFAEKVYNFKSASDKSIDSVLRKHGEKSARLEVPMLHPDDIKVTANYIKKLAEDLDLIAYSKEKNASKIFHARWVVSACGREIQERCRHNILYARGNMVIK